MITTSWFHHSPHSHGDNLGPGTVNRSSSHLHWYFESVAGTEKSSNYLKIKLVLESESQKLGTLNRATAAQCGRHLRLAQLSKTSRDSTNHRARLTSRPGRRPIRERVFLLTLHGTWVSPQREAVSNPEPPMSRCPQHAAHNTSLLGHIEIHFGFEPPGRETFLTRKWWYFISDQ